MTVRTDAAQTEALVKAIVTNAANLPIAALELREGLMPPERQHQLGSLLIELGELLHKHADTQTEPAEMTGRRSLVLPDTPPGSCLPPP